MFSIKNIKATFNEKIKNSDSKTEMAVGVAEVAGKSLVAGATALVYHSPDIAIQVLEDKIKQTNKFIKDGKVDEEDAKRFKELSKETQKRMDKFSQSRSEKEKRLLYALSNEAIEKREIKKMQDKIRSNHENIKNLQEELEKLRISDKDFYDSTNLVSENSEKFYKTQELQDLSIENANKQSSIIEQIHSLVLEIEKLEHRLIEYGVNATE